MKKPVLMLLIFLSFQCIVYAENSTSFYKKGVESFKAGNITEAEQNFKKAVEANPSYTLGHYGLGRVYIKQKGRIPDAIKHLKHSVSLDPNFSRGWFKLGLAEFLSGKYIDSIHSFREAYDRDKTFVEALYNIGVIYDLLGKEYTAFTYYRLYTVKIKGEKSAF